MEQLKQTPGATDLLRVKQWDTNRWAIMLGPQIIYYAKDEVDATVTLDQWAAAPLLNTALYALYHLTVAMKGVGNAGVSQMCLEALESVHGGPPSDESKAVAALIAEAHNVANESGMWPREMQERIKKLEEAMPKFQEQGVSFGRFWISYDKLVGCDWNPGANRDAFWRENVFAKNLHQWLADHHPEVFTTPSTII